jgi:hypothetical protein
MAMTLVLVLKAHEARTKDHRRTEMWLYLPRESRPPLPTMSENDDLVSVIESTEATLAERIAAAWARHTGQRVAPPSNQRGNQRTAGRNDAQNRGAREDRERRDEKKSDSRFSSAWSLLDQRIEAGRPSFVGFAQLPKCPFEIVVHHSPRICWRFFLPRS